MQRILTTAMSLSVLLATTAAYADPDVVQGTVGPLGNIINQGDVDNEVSIDITDVISEDAAGTSVSAGANGAVASVSISAINSTNGFEATISGDFDDIEQRVRNRGEITNTLKSLDVAEDSKLGSGSAISFSAGGAVASFLQSGNIGGKFDGVDADDIDQRAHNRGDITNDVGTDGRKPINLGEIELSGKNSQISFGASGATSSISASFIDVNPGGREIEVEFDDITQVSTNGSLRPRGGGDVTNNVARDVNVGDISGDGASLSLTAIGSSTGISASGNGVGGELELEVENIDQLSDNIATIRNNASSTNISAGELSGDGASIAVVSIGASATFNATNISGADTDVEVDDVVQLSLNDGNVRNSFQDATLTTGELSGTGSSVSISAVGASSSLSVSEINSVDTATLDSESIFQEALNTGNIVNTAGDFNGEGKITQTTVGELSGIASSVGISAVGASSSVSLSSMNSQNLTTSLGRGVTQAAFNSGNVTNNAGVINVNGISGNGASVSASAVGASASLSFSSVQ